MNRRVEQAEAEIHAFFDAAVARIEKYREFAAFVKGAPVSSGVCCCGVDMADEQDHEGHTPVDQWHYSLSQWLKELKQVDPSGEGFIEGERPAR